MQNTPLLRALVSSSCKIACIAFLLRAPQPLYLLWTDAACPTALGACSGGHQVAIKVMTEALTPEKCAGFSVVVMVDAPLDDCIAYSHSPTAPQPKLSRLNPSPQTCAFLSL